MCKFNEKEEIPYSYPKKISSVGDIQDTLELEGEKKSSNSFFFLIGSNSCSFDKFRTCLG